jgi:hypothetical protein
MFEELPDELLKAIGSVSVASVLLERVMQFTISESIGIDENLMQRLIATDSFDTLLSKFKKLFIYKIHNEGIENKELLDELNKLCDTLYKTNEKRNKFLHSFWFTDEKGNLSRHKFKKSINKNPSIDEFETITLESLNKFLEEMDNVVAEVENFGNKIINLLSNIRTDKLAELLVNKIELDNAKTNKETEN